MKSVASTLFTLALLSFMTLPTSAAETGLTQREFGTFEGRPVTLFTLTNQAGLVAQITDYGGAVVSLKVPDRDGTLGEVVLGYDNFESYKKDKNYLGAVAGRYANRITEGRFSIDGNDYQLATNNGPNHLHGGVRGFDKRLWKATPSMEDGQPQLKLEYLSPDGEEGYPGNLAIAMTYTLTVQNELRIDYVATTDKPTLCNPTHHSYWNLAGPASDTILQHELQLHCDRFTPTDATGIPTGELREVADTPFDFREPHPIGQRIDAETEQLEVGHGYDHNFVINGKAGTLRPVARVDEKTSGRVMEVLSTDHGVQFYSGNFFDGEVVGRDGRVFNYRTALCLECQRFPNSPNQPEFPSATLRPGETYEKTTVYRFSAQ